MLQLIYVVIVWICLLVVVTGIGFVLLGIFGGRVGSVREVFTTQFVGWGGVIAILQVWHLFLPVDFRAFALCAGVGVGGLLFVTRGMGRVLARKNSALVVFGVLFLFAAFWLANQAVDQPRMYDSGLYYANAIKWISTFPAVPGLGLLHHRLAFNNSSFLCAAMLNVGPFTDKYHHLASGLLILIAFGRCLWSWVQLTSDGRTMHKGCLFDCLFLAPIVVWVMLSGSASSPSPDVANYLLGFIVASEMVDLLSGVRRQSDVPAPHGAFRNQPTVAMAIQSRCCDNRLSSRLFTVVFLCMVGVSNKLAFVGFGIAACLVSLVCWWRVAPCRKIPVRIALGTGLLCTVLMGGWAIRGVISSGYIAFPSTVGAFDVEWRVPSESALQVQLSVKGWARMPDDGWRDAREGWRWLWPWVNRIGRIYYVDVVTPLGLTFLGLLLFGLTRCRYKPREGTVKWLLVTAGVGLVFWFLAAPNPRFSGSLFWIGAVGSLTMYFAGWHRQRIIPVLYLYSVLIVAQSGNPIELLKVWKRDAGPIRRVEMRTMVTESGLEVYVPRKGDQCWDAPLPCTPYFDRSLRLRKPGDLRNGFVCNSPPQRESVIAK